MDILYRIRHTSLITGCWWLFYTVVVAGFFVPDELLKWFTYVIAAPGAILLGTILIVLLVCLVELGLRLVVIMFKRLTAPSS